MSKTARLKALRAFLKSNGYGRGYKHSGMPVYIDDPVDGLVENGGMEREQYSTAEIAAEAVDGERWIIDIWAPPQSSSSGHTIDFLYFTFPAGRCDSSTSKEGAA